MNPRILYCCLIALFISFFAVTNIVAEEQSTVKSEKNVENQRESENIAKETVPSETPEAAVPSEAPEETVPSEAPEAAVPSEAPEETVPSETPEAAVPSEILEDSVLQPEKVAAAQELAVNTDEASESSFYTKFIKDRVQIGTRSAHRILTDDDSGHKGGGYGSGTFLGTIYGLDAKQNYFPRQLYGRFFINDIFGVEIGYDQYKAKSLTRNPPYTDGDLEVSGITLSLIGFYRNTSKFTPYLGLGLGFFSSNFSEIANWRSSYNGLRQRRMITDDVNATIVSLGVLWEFTERWNLDLSAKYIGNADIDAVFKGYTYGILDTVQPGHFPMDSYALQIGVSYTF